MSSPWRESARDRGFRPLDIPANYYDDIEARYDIDPALLDELKELNVMYDRDESGEFLHFYTPPDRNGLPRSRRAARRLRGLRRAQRARPPRRPVPAARRGEGRSVGVIRHVAVFRFVPHVHGGASASTG